MMQPRYQDQRRRPVTIKRHCLAAADQRETRPTIKVLAREELREIVRRLALGDRPGIALDSLTNER